MKTNILNDLINEGFSISTIKSLSKNQIKALHKRLVKEDLDAKIEKVMQLKNAIKSTEEDLNNLASNLEEQDEEDDPQEITVGSYQTKYFDVCPGASELYANIEDKVEDMDLAERTAKLQDALFYIEKHILEDDETGTDEGYMVVAENLAEQIMDMAEMMGLEDEHSYIQGHVDIIRKAVEGEEEIEMGEGKKHSKKMKTPITTLGMFEGQSSLALDNMSGRDPYEKGGNLDMGPGEDDGFNDSDDGMGIFEKEEMKEKFRSKAQQGYFFAKCEEEGPKSKWCKMAREFADDTKDFSKLPEKVKNESYKRKVRQLENKILSLLESENKPSMTKKDLLNLLENTPGTKEAPVVVPTKTPSKPERKSPFKPKHKPKPKGSSDVETAPTRVKPGTKEKPERKNPFKPKHKPNPKGESGDNKVPEFLSFDNLNIKFKDE